MQWPPSTTSDFGAQPCERQKKKKDESLSCYRSKIQLYENFEKE